MQENHNSGAILIVCVTARGDELSALSVFSSAVFHWYHTAG